MPRIPELIARIRSSKSVSRVKKDRMTYLSFRKLNSLEMHIKTTFANFKEPLFVEFGVALGGSAAVITETIQSNGRGAFVGYDMFGMIPPPSENDESDSHTRYEVIQSGQSKGLRGEKYYGYEDDLLDKVTRNLQRLGLRVDGKQCRFVKGDFRESFQAPADKISLMHIDCDWYDSVAFCLEKTIPHLAVNGIVIVDDYNDYQGCRVATDAFLESNSQSFRVLQSHPHLVIQRVD